MNPFITKMLILILACSGLRAWSQPVSYQFLHLDVNSGLSHNQVTCFLKDKRGFLWIGTSSGLNRFDGYSVRAYLNDADNTASISDNAIKGMFETPDGKLGIFTDSRLNIYDPGTEKFSVANVAFYNTYGLPPGELTDVVKDHQGNYWFIHQSAGMVRYDIKERKSFYLKRSKSDPASVSTDSVSAYVAGKSGTSWIIHRNGILEQIEVHGQSYRVVHRDHFLFRHNHGKSYNYKLMADHDGDLWIFVKNDPQGLYIFNPARREFQHIHQQSSVLKLSSNLVSSIVQEDSGMIWVGTDHGGVNLIDKSNFTVRYVSNQPEEERSLGQNTINTIYRDDEGILWLGTFKKGVSYYHKNLIRFPLYKHYPLSRSGLPYGDVNRFAEDKNGNLWIGTNGGGLIYFDRRRNTFKQFLHDPGDPGSISSNVIVSLCIDHQQKLWIGTYYGGLNVYDGRKFERYTHDPEDPASISDRNVWEIFEDSHQRLWIGTMHGGLNLFDRKTNSFSHYRAGDVNSVGSDYIAAITEDRSGNIWIGTEKGIDMLERGSGRFFHYGSAKNVKDGLSDDFIFDILPDSRGRMWIATRNGLNIFDAAAKTFTVFKEKHGLPHNTILSILEDSQGSLWLSTFNGLCNIASLDPKNAGDFQFRNYDESDGLQGKQFNENAALKTSRGELIFGGANGFNIFYPEKLDVNKNPPRIILSDFQLYNKSLLPGELVNGEVLLPRSISETQAITLPPGLNVFSIAFVALGYFNPEKNQYQYMLQGSQTGWLKADAKSRRVTFTNLSPGEYTFIVRASNNDGYWNEKGTSLKITVLPPFWKTRMAFGLYVVSIIIALLITRRLIQKRERIKFDREQERKEAIRMHELDMMKIKFFTNVSHEFRTPITLILTPLEKLLRHAKEPDLQQQYLLIQRNARRLLNLVNQLLDFRKLEVQEPKLNASEGDIIRFISETVYSFSDLSEKKDIRLTFQSSVESLETLFDQDKLEKILFNLLSNAFKFTPEHGAVSVNADVKEYGRNKFLQIRVQDNGIGIASDKLERIFDRFFQNELPKSFVNQGSGIGLSITKEFVKIHGGTISVESDPGKGTCFIVQMPVKEVLHPAAETALVETAAVNGNESEAVHPKKPVLLLVEDNEDFRFYLKDNLQAQYRIMEARNGSEGWKITTDILPDLIVSDIMMPHMNGIELCRKIKSDPRVSHIPVLLLTARSAEEQKLEGYDSGANDYITKPFNFEILASRIKNLIVQQQKSQKAFQAQLSIKASELKITSLDELFIQKAVKCVEDHIADPDFSVEGLSHELGLSRAHFYKKMMTLTGKSPLEFIRMIRLQQAAQLLRKSRLTVAEVAYKVGFNSPKYFARYFREAYKVLPSAFAANSKNEGA